MTDRIEVLPLFANTSMIERGHQEDLLVNHRRNDPLTIGPGQA